MFKNLTVMVTLLQCGDYKGNEINQFMKPWGIGVDSKGYVYVGDQENPVYKSLITMAIL